MNQLVLRLFDVMRLRAGPQDMPPGWGFAVLFSVIYLSEGFFADQILDETDGAPRSLVAVTIQFLAIFMLLRIRSLSTRLPQTLTALAATGSLFGALSTFLAMQSQPGIPQPGLALAWFAAFFWSLTVDAHIYRHAMTINMSQGMLVAVLIFALNFVVIQVMFGS
jgi:hypothetical protein